MSIGKLIPLVICFLITGSLSAQELYHANSVDIAFVSEAPLEVIRASSSNCQGIVNMTDGEFAFRVFIKTFEGFNNRLQQTHFYENYMETDQFPESVFSGFIVEDLPEFDEGEVLKVRAKGNLTIHGVTREQIIPVTLEYKRDEVLFRSDFSITLADYDIKIPSIVKQKIAESIKVSVAGSLKKK